MSWFGSRLEAQKKRSGTGLYLKLGLSQFIITFWNSGSPITFKYCAVLLGTTVTCEDSVRHIHTVSCEDSTHSFPWLMLWKWLGVEMSHIEKEKTRIYVHWGHLDGLSRILLNPQTLPRDSRSTLWRAPKLRGPLPRHSALTKQFWSSPLRMVSWAEEWLSAVQAQQPKFDFSAPIWEARSGHGIVRDRNRRVAGLAGSWYSLRCSKRSFLKGVRQSDRARHLIWPSGFQKNPHVCAHIPHSGVGERGTKKHRKEKQAECVGTFISSFDIIIRDI